MLVLGAPGTGKPRAAHTLNWYCAQHGRPGFFATAAFAWTAALVYNTPVQRALSTHTMFEIKVLPKNELRQGGLTAQKVREYVGNGGLILDEVGYNSLEHLGACSRSANRHISQPSKVPEDHPARHSFTALPRLMLVDAGQNTAPGGTPVHKYAAQLLADPTFTPLLPPPAPPQQQDDNKDKNKKKDKDRDTQKDGAAPHRWTENNSNLAAGFMAFRTYTTTIQLTVQQRQDNTPGGRLLQQYVPYFDGRDKVSRQAMAKLGDAINATTINGDVAEYAKHEPRVVLQRNKPRHRLNTRLLQHLAKTKNVRPIVWNAQHRIVANKNKK